MKSEVMKSCVLHHSLLFEVTVLHQNSDSFFTSNQCLVFTLTASQTLTLDYKKRKKKEVQTQKADSCMAASFARLQAKAVKGAADCGSMVGGRSDDSGTGETLYPAKQVKVQIHSLTPAHGHRDSAADQCSARAQTGRRLFGAFTKINKLKEKKVSSV